jgi:predicted nucleic acid-binding protein
MRQHLREAISQRERMAIPTLALYEWLRGPRVNEELAAQEALFPSREALPFGPDEALVAAELYRELPRPRGREVDLAIAACALIWKARIWTLNVEDFADIPGLDIQGR